MCDSIQGDQQDYSPELDEEKRRAAQFKNTAPRLHDPQDYSPEQDEEKIRQKMFDNTPGKSRQRRYFSGDTRS